MKINRIIAAAILGLGLLRESDARAPWWSTRMGRLESDSTSPVVVNWSQRGFSANQPPSRVAFLCLEANVH